MDFAEGEEAAGRGRRSGDGLREGHKGAEEGDNGRKEAGKYRGDSLGDCFHVYKSTAVGSRLAGKQPLASSYAKSGINGLRRHRVALDDPGFREWVEDAGISG
jgi:hypothetical protein